MKKVCIITLLIFFGICNTSKSQILCLYCFDQNDSISSNVNNLILNGGFENSTCLDINDRYCPNSSSYNCDIDNWICTGGSNSTYACIVDTNFYSTLIEGTHLAYFGNSMSYLCSPTLGDTSCLGDSSCMAIGISPGYPYSEQDFGGNTGVSLEQTVTGLIIGETYVLEFWTGGEWPNSYPDRGLFAVDIGFGNMFLRNRPYHNLSIGNRFIIEFAAISTSHTIKFTNWGHICSSCTELMLDDVRLYTLAELSASIPPCGTGVDDISSGYIVNVHPNPINTQLNVETDTNEMFEIDLFDISSRKVINHSFMSSTTVNTEQLAKGIYLYEVSNKNGVIKKGKILKD